MTAATVNFRPQEDRILVLPLDVELKTAGGLFLPETVDKDKIQSVQAKVIAVGPGRLNADGDRAEMEVSVGDTVVLRKNTGFKVSLEGTEYIITTERDCLAKVSEQ